MSKEVADEYLSSLSDLTVNSKPLINMLTMLADENSDHAPAIVKAIESHINKVSTDVKLPVLYLIDSIVKNVTSVYVPLFTHNIVHLFVSVFEKVDEKVRLNMYKLRQTWSALFPPRKLYALDLRVKEVDPGWPVTAPPPTSIHLNPKFLANKSGIPEISAKHTAKPAPVAPTQVEPAKPTEEELREQLLKKQKILLQLQQKKLDLELMQTRVYLEEQKQAMMSGLGTPTLNEQAVKLLVERATLKPTAVVLPPVVQSTKQVHTPLQGMQGVSNVPKTRIAPVTMELLEAVKSRDPRIARQQAMLRHKMQQPIDVTSKENEIKSRQLAMLKAPVFQQVVRVGTKVPGGDVKSNKGPAAIGVDKTKVAREQTVKKHTKESYKPVKDSSKDKRSARSKVSKESKSDENRDNDKPRTKRESSPKRESKSKHSKSESRESRHSRKSSRSAGSKSTSGSSPKTDSSPKSSPKSSSALSNASVASNDAENLLRIKRLAIKSMKFNKLVKEEGAGRQKKEVKVDKPPVPVKVEPVKPDPSWEVPCPSPEPPPPPIISQNLSAEKMDWESEEERKPDKIAFKGAKGAAKGRNYMRRNRTESVSPEPDGKGDVDLRLPTKDKPSDIEKDLVNVSGMDVDLRQLTVASPSKKRLSTEAPSDEPPKKRNKARVFDELFGNEDVDLRQLPAGSRLPSPPPPPVISNNTSPQVATVPTFTEESKLESPSLDEHNQEDTDSKPEGGQTNEAEDKGKSWAEVKVKPEVETKPSGQVQPMSLSSQLEMEMSQGKVKREPQSPIGELDRLGRPLLYNRLPDDPRARRESLNLPEGRDTDMRRSLRVEDFDVDSDSVNMNLIVAQADEQLQNGIMSQHQYNELLKQVIRVNEVQKLREAQNKDRQDGRRPLYHRGRSPPERLGPGRNSPSYEEDRRDRRTFNDIDERRQSNWRSHYNDQQDFNRGQYQRGRIRNYDRGTFDTSRPDMWQDDRFARRNGRFTDMDNRSQDMMPMYPERTADCTDIPPPDPATVEMISKDKMKSINIDGQPRDIRFYGDTAVVMLSWDNPKQITFEQGRRRIKIGELTLQCNLNDKYQTVVIDGHPHRVRLGAPTRELYIDGEHYEAHFGGQPVTVTLNGLPYHVTLEGPPPQVKIGDKRTDLVCGQVNLIVDASMMVPVYLDSKPQGFELLCRPYVLRFTNSLRTVLINNVPVSLSFGGDCKQICGYNGDLHFIRLSMLPNTVVPGRIEVANVEPVVEPSVVEFSVNSNDSQTLVLPLPPPLPEHFPVPQPPTASGGGEVDVFTSAFGSAMYGQPSAAGYNYQVEHVVATAPMQPAPVQQPATGKTANPMNITDLFQRLVASGIVPSSSAGGDNQQSVGKRVDEPAKKVDFVNPDSLKVRQPAIVSKLYLGIQCSSCGVRFAPLETLKYSRHLDWHFRQNRRDKDAAKKGHSRKWYYDVSDWIQFEEIEDLEERAQSWFEKEVVPEEPMEVEQVKSVAAPPGNESIHCEMCRDRFDTFYNEDTEEWHLKHCIIIEEKYYHPVCYEDMTNMPDETFATEKSDPDVVVQEVEEELETKCIEEPEVTEDPVKQDTDAFEADDEEIRTIVEGIVTYVVVEEELRLREEEEQEEEEEEEAVVLEEEEEDLEVLESLTVETKKTIIAVDLIEKPDDEVYEPRAPSPIIFMPSAKIKQEPLEEMESAVAVVDQTVTNVVSSIDGNVEMSDAPALAPAAPSKIKITFNKPIAAEQPAEKSVPKVENVEPCTDDEDCEPLSPGPKKPKIANCELTEYPKCEKGTEISGLCSIM